MVRHSEAAYTVFTTFELFQVLSKSLDAWFASSCGSSSHVGNAETSLEFGYVLASVPVVEVLGASGHAGRERTGSVL